MQEDIRIEWLNRKPFVFAVFSCRNHAHSVGVWTVETQLPTSGLGLGTPKAGWKLGGWKRGPWNERCPCHHVIPQLCCTWETLKMRKWENLKNGKSQSVLVDKLIKWKEIVLSHKKKTLCKCCEKRVWIQKYTNAPKNAPKLTRSWAVIKVAEAEAHQIKIKQG